MGSRTSDTATLLRLHPSYPPTLRRSFPFSWVTDFGHWWLPWCDGRCVADRERIHTNIPDLRLLAIQLHIVELQFTIRTETLFCDLLDLRALLHFVYALARVLAQIIKGHVIWRHPHLPRISGCLVDCPSYCWLLTTGLRSLRDLTQHLDTSWQQPHAFVSLVPKGLAPLQNYSRVCQRFGKVL